MWAVRAAEGRRGRGGRRKWRPQRAGQRLRTAQQVLESMMTKPGSSGMGPTGAEETRASEGPRGSGRGHPGTLPNLEPTDHRGQNQGLSGGKVSDISRSQAVEMGDFASFKKEKGDKEAQTDLSLAKEDLGRSLSGGI